MRSLLINTCGAEGVVALAEEDAVLAVECLPGRAGSEHLMPAIKRLFDGKGEKVRELGAIVVVNGPGSFTGARVGLSVAKGLAEAGGAHLLALSRLALVAAASTAEATNALALLHAGRSEFFCYFFRDGTGATEELLGLETVRHLLGSRQGITCEPQVADALGDGITLILEPGPEQMLTMARERMARGAWDDVALSDANYLRRTDAELLADSRGGTAC